MKNLSSLGLICLGAVGWLVVSAYAATQTPEEIWNRVFNSATGMLKVAPIGESCTTTQVNAQGTAGADITVDNTAGGVTVMAASATRCGALLKNTSVANARCAPTGLTPTASVGFLVKAGENLILGPEGRQAWKCIRTDATSAVFNVAEAMP